MDMKAHDSHAGDSHRKPGVPPTSGLKDPVCGMSVTTQSTHRLQHEGRPVYFCSVRCQEKFAANPAAYPTDLRSSRHPFLSWKWAAILGC